MFETGGGGQRVEAAVTLFTRVVPVAARRMLFRSLAGEGGC